MWVDESFSSSESSLFFECKDEVVHWMRPQDLCPNPVLRRKEKASLPIQGALGDCWLICAFAILAKSDKAWQNVFKDEENCLNAENHTGKITLNLWNAFSGNWFEVEVDDSLPVRYNADISAWQLIYSQCSDSSQFWVPLLEKACAKFYGCYKALHSGQISEGCLLLTGGYCLTQDICTEIDDKTQQLILAKIITLLSRSDSFVFASCGKSFGFRNKAETDNSDLHAYAIVGTEGGTSLNDASLYVWDPWKKSREASNMLSMPRLCENRPCFTFLSLNLENIVGNPTCLSENNSKWVDTILRGEWKALSSSGGSRKLVSYFQNPQYLFSFRAGIRVTINACILHITVIQFSHRKYEQRKVLEQAIGLHVFELSSMPKKPLSLEQLKSCNCVCLTAPEYQYSQNASLLTYLTTRLNHLAEQYYLIVPSTHSPNVNIEFVLRVSCNMPYNFVMLQ